MKQVSDFFLLCSGVNLNLLEKCPTERSKYAGLGATIFFTGLFAFISAAYALYSTFDQYLPAILLGLVWGLMIFNLDRFIVSSMRKEGRMGKEFLSALPRILVALVISVVVAKPLELKIFEKEIQPEVVVMEQNAFLQQENKVRNRFSATGDSLQSEIIKLENQLAEKNAERNALLRAAQEEADGTGGSRVKNLGPIYKLKKADADRAESELNTLKADVQAKIISLSKQVQRNDSLMQKELSSVQLTRRNGIASKLEALDRLKATSQPIYWASLFIMLLFIAIETAPVLVKLISPRGPYDNLLKIEEFGFVTNETSSVAETSADARRKSLTLPQEENAFVNNQLDDELKRV